VSSVEAAGIRELELERRELRRANEILKRPEGWLGGRTVWLICATAARSLISSRSEAARLPKDSVEHPTSVKLTAQ